jgi:autotransporter-associated beta strand protein
MSKGSGAAWRGLAACAAALATFAGANGQTWIGGASGLWSNPLNWSAPVVGGPSAVLTFGAAVNDNSLNDFSGALALNTLRFVNGGTGLHVMGGNPLRFTAPAAGDFSLLSSARNFVAVGNDLILDRSLRVDAAQGDVHLNGALSGAGQALLKQGAGTLWLGGANGTGSVQIRAGAVVFKSGLALPATGYVQVDAGAYAAIGYAGAGNTVAPLDQLDLSGGLAFDQASQLHGRG